MGVQYTLNLKQIYDRAVKFTRNERVKELIELKRFKKSNAVKNFNENMTKRQQLFISSIKLIC